MLSEFLLILLLSYCTKQQIEVNSTSNERTNILVGVLRKFKYAIPAREEQKRIVRYVKVKNHILSEIKKKLQNEIDLLEEYKQSLIFEAVTGKIDVRDYKN